MVAKFLGVPHDAPLGALLDASKELCARPWPWVSGLGGAACGACVAALHQSCSTTTQLVAVVYGLRSICLVLQLVAQQKETAAHVWLHCVSRAVAVVYGSSDRQLWQDLFW